jgi:hypothetical protein
MWTPAQERGPDHGVNADQADCEARELTNTFQHALSHGNTDIDEDAMDVDNDTNNGEGEDDEEDEVGVVDPQVQSAKEWVRVRTHGL